MQIIMFDTSGTIHFEGENYIKENNSKDKWFMTNHCNIPRKVINDEIINGTRYIHLSKYPL